MNFTEELKWRGMIHDMMPGTAEQLQKEMTTAYVGIDPTADSLHIGHLVGVMMLKHLQECGHRPIVLLGGATGMIGDPSGKSQERNLLDSDTLRHNQECIRKQLSKFLDFDSTAPNAAILVNNYDWMSKFSFLDFIRDIGKHITVNYMMAKDSVKKRFNGEGDGMSFTEFSYQLVQGYDFLYLNQNYNCKLQMGGSDQWGNITTGTELIRRKTGGEAYALTCPLITKADGGKFGKTEKGNIWLDPERTSPYTFYQFWLNCSERIARSTSASSPFTPKRRLRRWRRSTKPRRTSVSSRRPSPRTSPSASTPKPTTMPPSARPKSCSAKAPPKSCRLFPKVCSCLSSRVSPRPLSPATSSPTAFPSSTCWPTPPRCSRPRVTPAAS